MKTNLEKLVKERSLIFWDFDDVIKESVLVKSEGFTQLFLPYGKEVADRVRQHHESHRGVSRYEKMPIYLRWAGESATTDQVHKFCDLFSRLVLKAVVDAPWVPGVREYLQSHHGHQCFVLVTASPQEEIQQILHASDITHCFREVHGSQIPKAKAIRDVLARFQCHPEQALSVGDSETDFDAAKANEVTFLLRRTPLNRALQERYSGPTFDNLSHE